MGKYCHKVVVVGDPNVGKNTLLTKYAKLKLYCYTSVVFEHEMIKVKVGEDKVVELSIWNTTGVEMNTPIIRDRIKGAHAIIICYGIDIPHTFDNVDANWMSVIRQVCPCVPVILVGCKKFLRTHPSTLSSLAHYGKEPVSEKDAMELAEHIGAWAYLECSVLEGVDEVDEIFEIAACACLQTKPKKNCNVL